MPFKFSLLSPLLLLALLSGMIGCTFSNHPPYEPLTDWKFPRKGYIDYEIDPDTFLVTYLDYSRYELFPDRTKLLADKWLEGAQDYVLYRAAELSRSKGAESFVVLHRDDWNHIGSFRVRRQASEPLVRPGAGIMIRLLRTAPREPRDGVYDVRMLLSTLPIENSGLPRDLGVSSLKPSNRSIFGRKFQRWRAYTGPYISVPLSSEGLNISRWSPETKTTKVAANQFELEAWHYELISPIVFLGECVRLAEREGYDFFTVADWIDEEHHGYAFIWFRTRGRVTLHQAMPETLEAAFRVPEIKANVDIESIKRKRLVERQQMIDRDLEAGLIY